MRSRVSCCAPGRHRTSAPTSCCAIDDPARGRELMGRLAELVDSAANWWQPALPAMLNVGADLPGARSARGAAGSLNSFPDRVPAGDGGPRGGRCGDTGRERARSSWEAPLGTGRCPRRAGPRRRRPGVWRLVPRPRAPGAHDELPGVEPIWRQDCLRAADRAATRSASRTASAIRPSKAAASPATTRTRRRSRPASSCWAIRTRPATCRRCRSPTCWAATAPTWSSASCTRAWRPSGSTCATKPPARTRRSCWPPSSSAAGRSGAPLVLAPERDDPELGADPQRNNDFLYGGRPARPQLPARRARPADEPARRGRSSASRACTA